MLELRLVQAASLKNVLEAISVLDLFSEVNFEFSGTGFELQAMDTSGAALVAFLLRADAFNHYLCDRDLSMGLNLADMANVFRCANNDDILTIKVDGCPDTVMFVFESPKVGEISYFDLHFVDINRMPCEIPEIPESEYQAIVRMPSAKFMRICKKLSSVGDREDRDTVASISVDKERVDFFTSGKAGTSTIFCTVGKPKEPYPYRRTYPYRDERKGFPEL